MVRTQERKEQSDNVALKDADKQKSDVKSCKDRKEMTVGQLIQQTGGEGAALKEEAWIKRVREGGVWS